MNSDFNNQKLLIPDDIFFDCLHCGFCCKRLSLTIDIEEYQNIINHESFHKIKSHFKNSDLFDIPPNSYIQGAQKVQVDTRNADGTPAIPAKPVYSRHSINDILIKKRNDSCIFLEDNICLLHKEIDSWVKPYPCRRFPFVISQTPDGVYVGVSYRCEGIKQNRGNELKKHSSSIIKLLQEKPVDLVINDNNIKLTDFLSIDYSSYKKLEEFVLKCLELPDIIEAAWIPLSMFTALVSLYLKKNIDKINHDILDEILTMPLKAPILRNNVMLDYQVEFTSSIISVLEMWKDSVRKENCQTILKGGRLKSDTFLQTIDIQPFHHYLFKENKQWDKSGFRDYLKHIVKWRKQLLRFNNIFTGLTALSFLPFIFCWYGGVAAKAENKEEPGNKEFAQSKGIIDTYIHHNIHPKIFFKEFGDGILREIKGI